MKKSDLHIEKKPDISSGHKDMLGMDIPENYFSSSKSRIIQKVSLNHEERRGIFYLKPAFRYAVAAAIVILIGLGVSLKFLPDTENNNSIGNLESIEYASMQDEDVLLDLLLVKDSNVELFLDEYLLEGVLVKAELEEQEFDNLFMNSLLVKDSLLDTYIDDRFIDDIIL